VKRFVALGIGLLSCTSPVRNTPLGNAYRTDGSILEIETPPAHKALGLFGVDVALADLNGDLFPELIESSGANTSPQPLIVYANRTWAEPFEAYPSWYSATIEHRGALAIGDLFGDGRMEVVVPVMFDRLRTDGGWIEVFSNTPDAGLSSAPQTLDLGVPGMNPVAVALGDLDGDGDLDLVAVGVFGLIANNALLPAPVLLYLNQDDGGFARPVSLGNLAAASVKLADLNADGWLELIVGGPEVTIFGGKPGSFRTPSKVPSYRLGPHFNAAYGLEVANTERKGGLSVVVSDNCHSTACAEQTRLWLFRPDPDGGLPAPKGEPLLSLVNGGRAATLEANDDGQVDLFVTQLGAGESGAPALLFGGIPGGFDVRGRLKTSNQQGAGIAIGDTVDPGVEKIYRLKSPNGIIPLPHRNITAVTSVLVDGAPAKFGWVPSTDWVSTPIDAGLRQIEVHYRTSRAMSIVVASHDPSHPPIEIVSIFPREDPR
jgi:hypothetical protein